MSEREKIIEALKRCENEWHKEEFDVMARAHFSYIEYIKLADALIAAGIGDVTAHESETEYWKTICKIESDEHHTAIKNAAEHARHLMQERDEYKHRAEVAERAWLLMARGECTFASPEFYKEEAEKEIAMEKQMMANRCGEGKCEYFESIRRAANNNRGNGYCKKYKRELHLYDWWWLKCDECTAEKELTEEKGA